MLHKLTAAELAQYRTDGFVLKHNVFNAQQLRALRVAADRAVATAQQAAARPDASTYFLDGNRFVDVGRVTIQFEHQPGSSLVRVMEPVRLLEAEFEQLIDDPRLVQPMQQIIGADDLALWTDKLNIKAAHEGSGFGWHQDSPYWIHASNDVDNLPNVMVYFDVADRSNGCLNVIAKSHLAGCLPGSDDQRQLAGFYTHADSVDTSRAVALEAAAGAAIFFNPHLIHGSQPNASSRPRRAIILTYQSAGRPALKTQVERPVRSLSAPSAVHSI